MTMVGCRPTVARTEDDIPIVPASLVSLTPEGGTLDGRSFDGATRASGIPGDGSSEGIARGVATRSTRSLDGGVLSTF